MTITEKRRTELGQCRLRLGANATRQLDELCKRNKMNRVEFVVWLLERESPRSTSPR